VHRADHGREVDLVEELGPGGGFRDVRAGELVTGAAEQLQRLLVGPHLRSLLPSLKSPGEAIDDFNARTKDAGEGLSKMAKPSVIVSGRAACLVAANGAPDCKAGADRLCQSKGHKEGKSLDTDAAEKCAPKVYLPGYKRQPGDCRNENYVTRALCQ
jgi:hypothetical protein